LFLGLFSGFHGEIPKFLENWAKTVVY
jgi:hypothetical protein